MRVSDGTGHFKRDGEKKRKREKGKGGKKK
jgi:hypothetical protein